MGATQFEYFSPKTLSEAFKLLMAHGKKTQIMAGGTDLLLKLRLGRINPQVVIGLKEIKELSVISFEQGKGIAIGAMVYLVDLLDHPDFTKNYQAQVESIKKMATVQIRNMATMVGNLCNAAPSADCAPVPLVMGATLNIVGANSNRDLLIDDFFKGPGINDLKSDEIVKSIFIPLPPKKSKVTFEWISPRSKVDISAVSVAVMLQMGEKEQKDKCVDAKIALGAVAPLPFRAKKAENLLKGKKLSPELISKVAMMASSQSRPISDVRASKDYRLKMVQVLTKRAIIKAMREN